jgi:hypothetical protein
VVAVHRTFPEARRTVSRLQSCSFPISDIAVRPRMLTFVPHEEHLDLRLAVAVLVAVGVGALAGGRIGGGPGAVLGGLVAGLFVLSAWWVTRWILRRRRPDQQPAGYVVADSFEVAVPERYAADALKVLAASRRDKAA